MVGIAGAKEKCDYVVDDLGFDACVNHRDPDLAGKLGDACPDGIDVYFENVGGAVFQAVLPLLNPFARVPVCGLIAQYNAKPGDPPSGPAAVTDLMRASLTKRLLIRGFIVYDFADEAEAFHAEMGEWVRSGEVRYREGRRGRHRERAASVHGPPRGPELREAAGAGRARPHPRLTASPRR